MRVLWVAWYNARVVKGLVHRPGRKTWAGRAARRGIRIWPRKTHRRTRAAKAKAVAAPRRQSPRPRERRRPRRSRPPWKVLLHNDDKNTHLFVVSSIVELTPLNEQEAKQRMMEADKTGVALLLTTHKERAELYQEQFQSKGLVVTIEPAE